MLAFLQPDGHEKLQFGPAAAQLRQNWEDMGELWLSRDDLALCKCYIIPLNWTEDMNAGEVVNGVWISNPFE